MLSLRSMASKGSGNGHLSLFVQAAFTGARLYLRLMPASRLLIVVIVIAAVALGLAAASPPPALAGAHHACLNKAEQRAAVASHRAISLSEAIRSLGKHGRRDVLRAELCRRGERLVYLLTLLARNGKVTHATVDAANGNLVSGH
jgi:hypothetical protein